MLFFCLHTKIALLLKDFRRATVSDDIDKTVINKLSKLHFALQIDESTDINGIAHVLFLSLMKTK